MCGIAGFIVPTPTTRAAFVLRGLLIANKRRGDHASGIYRSSDRQVIKRAVSSDQFIKDMDLDALAKSHLGLAHTRYATIGAKEKDENAHPFQFGNYVGVHNGGVSNYLKHYPEAEVDSQAIFHLLNKNDGNAKETFEHLQGSMAVAWTNTEENLLHLYRHTNPIHVGETFEGLFFSSEKEHLEIVLSTMYSDYNIVALEEGEYWKVSPNLQIEKTTIEAGKSVPRTPVYTAGAYSGGSSKSFPGNASRYASIKYPKTRFIPGIDEEVSVNYELPLDIVGQNRFWWSDAIDVPDALREIFVNHGPDALSDRQLYIILRALFGCHSCQEPFSGNLLKGTEWAYTPGGVNRRKEQAYCSGCLNKLSGKKLKGFHYFDWEQITAPMPTKDGKFVKFVPTVYSMAADNYFEELGLLEVGKRLPVVLQ